MGGDGVMAKLGECFSVIRNGASIRQTDGAGGFPITRIETIADKTINREKFGYAGIYDLAQYRDYILQDGDILMSHINSEKHLGKVALYSKQDDEQIIHGMNLLMLRADTQKVIPEYAKYYFESQKFLRQIGRITKKSVNQASFTVTALKELEIPLASIIVQRDISEKLKKVDWLVSLRKQQLAKLDELVKARFLEMFGEPVSNPMGWVKKSLQDVCYKLTDGTHFSPESYDKGDYKYITAKNIKSDGFDFSNITYVPESVHQTIYERCDPKLGDVLYIKDGATTGIAMVNSLEEEFSLLSSVALLKQNRKVIDGRFLCGVLNNAEMYKSIRNNMGGAAITRLTIAKLQKIMVIVPPLPLQNQFAAFVERVDQQKQTVQQSLEKLELLKKALMQEYFG